ncbi:hypothetical protein INT45_012471 [Circinella minor]|uniref:Uncharacterized protein n=1 Tax=Circinella minor TaxID=1195481 RepID=A0A8H7S0T9_9FUNG|nr:hypothetical protein INT45_012471 [Circinella minor]
MISFTTAKLLTSFKSVEESLHESNLQTLEEHSTKVLHALKDIETKLQFIRVMAYLQHGEISTARTIALSIQRTPSYQQESIQLIHILMEEKRYLDVIEMCDIFKPITVNQDQLKIEGENGEIVELRQKAMEKLEKSCRIDVMTKFPHEIRTLILDRLDFIDILNSNIRQQVILNEKTRQKSGSFSSQFYKSSMQVLSDGVKSLKIDYNGYKEEIEVDILTMLTSVSFNNLRVLTEEVHLNKVKLTCNEILDICPNLKRLSYETYDLSPQQHPQPQYSSLMYLYIHIAAGYEIEGFKQVLKRLSNLEEIIIQTRRSDLDSLRLIHQYGSKQLRHIRLNGPSPFYTPYDVLTTHDDTFIDTSRFDYTIDVHDCLLMTATLLLELINHSVNMKQKIKAVALCLPPDSRLNDWNSFKYFTSQCLQYIKFSFTKETEEIFANVILNCPTLEEVNIFRLLASPTNITMDALKTLPVLKCFSIENVESEFYRRFTPEMLFDDDDDDDGFVPKSIKNIDDFSIRQFFTYHALLDNHSTLQEVRLRHISNLKPETFETLFKIKSLKSLNFAGASLLSNDQSFGSIISSEEKSLLPSELENLVLHDVNGFTEDDLQFLDCSKILLAKLHGVTIDGLKVMMENSKKLNKLTVRRCGTSLDARRQRKELKDVVKRKNIEFELTL